MLASKWEPDPRSSNREKNVFLLSIHSPCTINQSFTNVPVFQSFMYPNIVALDFFYIKDFCFMRLIRRGAKNNFVKGSPIHCVL